GWQFVNCLLLFGGLTAGSLVPLDGEELCSRYLFSLERNTEEVDVDSPMHTFVSFPVSIIGSNYNDGDRRCFLLPLLLEDSEAPLISLTETSWSLCVKVPSLLSWTRPGFGSVYSAQDLKSVSRCQALLTRLSGVDTWRSRSPTINSAEGFG
ncbi:hypothetical protein LEMLEM_LOCUS7988, partial [Lemmus lemmus]